jgi:hypothetical protein
MTDPSSKEVPVIEMDVSLDGERVCRILDRLFLTGPLPEALMLEHRAQMRQTGLGRVGRAAQAVRALHSAGETDADGVECCFVSDASG